MRFKTHAQKNTMGKTNTTNASTSWVPSEFKQTDLTKAQADGLIADGDQVIFPSTERIPKPPSGFRVMFLAFLLRGLSFPAHEFLHGLLFVYGVQLHQLTQTRFCTLSVSLLFASRSWGSNPIFFSGNISFASVPVLLYQKVLSWAGLLFLSARSPSTWNFPWLPQCKVGGRSGFT
jgi:hypothetical protein